MPDYNKVGTNNKIQIELDEKKFKRSLWLNNKVKTSRTVNRTFSEATQKTSIFLNNVCDELRL